MRTARPTAEAAARLPRLQALSDQAAHQARLIARLYDQHARTLAELGRELAQLEPALEAATGDPEAPAEAPAPPPAEALDEPAAAAPRFAWRPPRHEPIRLEPIGEPCPHHPGEAIGTYGCPACNAGARWRARARAAQAGDHP